jgi:hypothetical protein
MNNILHLKQTDPVLDQLNKAYDKDAAYKTLAFKFFGGDPDKLDLYLEKFGESLSGIRLNNNEVVAEAKEYRQLAMF